MKNREKIVIKRRDGREGKGVRQSSGLVQPALIDSCRRIFDLLSSVRALSPLTQSLRVFQADMKGGSYFSLLF